MSEITFHERLGRGGYGEVYRATWWRPEDRDRVVAVKILNSSVQRGSDAQQRLRDEARLLGSVRHPNILRVYDLTELEGQVAMVAEYVPGEDLDRCVLDGLPPRALLDAIRLVATALAAAWDNPSQDTGKPLRLVHRDIKPENLRVRPDGRLKILDFGVARAAEMRREAETATNTVMGSYRYMAPERFDSKLEPHPSVDVFALGCILYEGLAYRRLFEHLSMREMMLLSIPGTDRYPMFLAERLEELPDTTEAKTINLIHRLVDRDPVRRPMPADVADLCQSLGDFLGGPTLEEWATEREWSIGNPGEGEWTGKKVELPLKSQSLDGGTFDDDFTPTPERVDRSGISDYVLPEGVEEPPMDEQTDASVHPVTLPKRRTMPAPDDVTISEAVNSLTNATSTPTGTDERVVPDPSAAETVSEGSELPEPSASQQTATEVVDVDELRRAIGMNPDRAPTPAPAPAAKAPPTTPRISTNANANPDQGAVMANLVVLAILGVLALIAVSLMGVIWLT